MSTPSPTIVPDCFRGKCRTTASALQLSDALVFDDWLAMGGVLARISRASAWWLGDWLVYGERVYPQRYKLAVGATSLDYQTLRNYAWVARRFELSRRRDSLSFQHHADLAGLPEAEQELWLQRAERHRWSRNQLRKQIAAARPRAGMAPEGDAVVLMIQVPSGRQRRWRDAAVAANEDLTDWIARVADHAADSLLELESSDVSPSLDPPSEDGSLPSTR